MAPYLKSILRSLYYLFNNGSITSMKGYKHLENCKWIIDRRLGMAYYKGYYEPEICAYLLKNITPDGVFVDVGAHAGYFSLFSKMLATNGAVYSFEPEPNNFSYIQTIKNLNKVSDWHIFNQAVGAENGTLFFKKGSSSTTGKIEENGDLPVKVVRLDDILSAVERVDIIKIDVEGFGGRVLEGAEGIIRKFKPTIMFELHKGSDELDVITTMLGNEYKLTDLDTGQSISGSGYPHFIIAEVLDVNKVH